MLPVAITEKKTVKSHISNHFLVHFLTNLEMKEVNILKFAWFISFLDFFLYLSFYGYHGGAGKEWENVHEEISKQ